MQFISSFSVASAALVALLAVAPAQAADNRQLVKFSAKTFPKGGSEFCADWKTNCENYVPTDKSLKFKSEYCQPGDFQGKNTSTEARVFCIYHNDAGDKSVIMHIAKETGNAQIQ